MQTLERSWKSTKTVDGYFLISRCFWRSNATNKRSFEKSLALGLKPIVVINKIDRPEATPEKVVDQSNRTIYWIRCNRSTRLVYFDEEGPAQMLVSNIDYDDYVGRIAVGRVEKEEL